MFRNKGNNNSKKNTIPSFKPLGDELLKDILPKFLKKEKEKQKLQKSEEKQKKMMKNGNQLKKN